MSSHVNGHAELEWNGRGVAGVPYKVFFDRDVYAAEQQRLFRGPVWNYIALDAEIAKPGDFKASFVGDTPVVVTRGRDGAIHGFVNRCAHRGALVCRELRGNSMT